MKILNPIPSYLLPPVGSRAYAVATSNKGNIVRSKLTRHIPRSSIPSAKQVALLNQPWSRWRRKWLAYIAHIWKTELSPTDITWWTTQAATVAFKNYSNITAIRSPFQFFIWYQTRWFDLHLDRYIPFPSNAADFPHKYAEPWAPPTLEPPTIVSASSNGQVIIRCLNVTPDSTQLEPVSWFMVHPPANGNFPIGYHPWFWSDRTDDDNYSQYTYDLSTPFPYIRPATFATLVHAYCLKGIPYAGIERDPTTTADIPIVPPIPWLLPDNALALDDVYTTAIIPTGPAFTNKLELANLTNTVPTEVTILGIQLAVWRRDQTLGSNLSQARLVDNDGAETDPQYENNSWDYGRQLVFYGNDSELWGRTWTPAQINAPGFRVRLQAGASGGGGGTPEIDWAILFVYYSRPGDTFTDQTMTSFEFA